MKKFIRILLVFFLALLLAIIVLPFAFKGKITSVIKEQVNENINAKVDFDRVQLNLLRSFPNLSLGIKDLSVINRAPFEGDTLFAADDLRLTLDLMTLFSGPPYEVKSIHLDKPTIQLISLADGTVNWDIAPSGTDTAQTTTPEEAESGFLLTLKSFTINNGSLIYRDDALPFLLEMKGLEHSLSGDLSASKTRLETNTIAKKVRMVYDGIPYLNGVQASVITGLDADLDKFIFSFRDGEVHINALKILASGTFAMPEEGYEMDIVFNAPGSQFAEVLSLVPAMYATDFSNIQTKGSFSLDGFVRGLYSDTQMPAFLLNLQIPDGYFKYPDLPSAVEDVRLNLKLENPDGDPDHTVIDLKDFHLMMAGAPLDASLHITQPVSDPYIKAALQTRLDLAGVQTFYPLAGTQLSGLVSANVALDGKLSAVETQNYQAFSAEGNIAMDQVSYEAEGLPSLLVNTVFFSFSPQQLSLSKLNMQAGETRLQANGFINNYLGWFLKEEVLRGEFQVNADRIDLNALMAESPDSETVAEDTAGTTALSVIHIPENIDFLLSLAAGQVLFGDLDIRNAKGQIRVDRGSVNLRDVAMQLMEGSITANGTYRAPAGSKPFMDMQLAVQDISIGKAYQQSGLMRKLAPVAAHTRGKVSTSVKLSGFLDEEMMPQYNSLAGGGSFSTTTLVIAGMPLLDKVGEVLSIQELKEAILDPVKASFSFKDGRVDVAPFDIKTKNLKGEVFGSTGFDQTLDYTMNLELPRSIMGAAANDLIAGWTRQAAEKGLDIKASDVIKVAVLVGGTIAEPQIRTGFKDMAGSLKEEIKQQVEEKVQEKLEEVKTEVREEAGKKAEEILTKARAEADKLMSEARKQAENVRSAGYQAAAKVRTEAGKEADKLIAEGKKKGPIAAALAEKAAEKVRQEAGEKATRLEQEADQKADGMVKEAQSRADKILEDAQKEADRI